MADDFDGFEHDLGRLTAAELAYRRDRLVGHELTALAMDCHPWHGLLDLAARTAADGGPKWDIGEWEMYPLSDAAGSAAPWTGTRSWAERMRAYWQAEVEKGTGPAGEATARLLRRCVAALRSDAVRHEVERLRLAADFALFVGDPDDPGDTNLCGAPVTPA